MSDFLDQLLTLPTVRAAYLSPDRRWLAYEWYRLRPFQDVFAVPTDGSSAPVALTSTRQVTRLVGWAPDSRAVLVSQDHDGDERASLFRVDLDRPGALQPLTEDRPG
jgi:tricorn protease-like protein